jgi:hypothetical protein
MSNPSQKRLTDAQRKILRDFIKKNPEATWKEFCAACKSFKISDAYYYMTRRDIHGNLNPRTRNVEGETKRRASSPLYLTVWSHPADKLGDETRAVLQDLVESLNGHKHTRWQLVELKNPAILELRERSR